LRGFAEDLAKLVVRDGEGATKFVTVRVKVSLVHSELQVTDGKGAPSYDVANAVAKSVASSSLVKTAMYGEGMYYSTISMTRADNQMPTGVEFYVQCEYWQKFHGDN